MFHNYSSIFSRPCMLSHVEVVFRENQQRWGNLATPALDDRCVPLIWQRALETDDGNER